MRMGAMFRRLSPAAVLAVGACTLALGAMATAEIFAHGQSAANDALVGAIVDRGEAGLTPANEGRLVRVVGVPRAGGPIIDTATSVRLDAVAARREVEMFQRIGRPGENRTWRVMTGWSGRPELAYDGTTDSIARDANPPFALPSGDAAAENVRVGSALVDADLARRTQFHAFRPIAPETVREALSRRFEGRDVRVDGEWVVIAAAPGDVTVGDLRLRYRVADHGRQVTVLGRQREGRLVAEPVPGIGSPVQIGIVAPADLLDRDRRDRPAETQFVGRAFGVGVLALALVFVACGGLRRRPAEQGGGWAWGVLAFGAGGGDDPVSAALGVVALLALLPFAIAVAPVAIALAVLAWFMAQGAAQMVAGLVLAAVSAAGLLTLTAGTPAEAP
jgi:hypothetical protein